MPWVHFRADFDWKPKPSVTHGYRAGMVCLVTRACAAHAIAGDKAETAKRPDHVSGKTVVAHRIPEAGKGR